MRRREFTTLLGSGAAVWPLAARAQQTAMPVIALVNVRSTEDSSVHRAAFLKGLNQTDTIEGQSATAEYHWLEGQYDRLAVAHGRPCPPSRGRDCHARLQAATTTIPIVFGVADDPVKLGLVANGNATGINYFTVEAAAKRLDQRF